MRIAWLSPRRSPRRGRREGGWVWLLLAGGLFAQAASSTALSLSAEGRRVLERHLASLGGPAGLTLLSSIQYDSRLTVGDQVGTLSCRISGDRLWEHVQMGGRRFGVTYDGAAWWDFDEEFPPTEVEPERVPGKRFKRDVWGWGLARRERWTRDVEDLGQRVEDGLACYGYRVSYAQDQRGYFWIDPRSGHLMKVTYESPSGMWSTRYSDFREIRGCALPFHAVSRYPRRASDWVEERREIVVGVPTAPEAFVPPAPTADWEWPDGVTRVELPFEMSQDLPYAMIRVGGFDTRVSLSSDSAALGIDSRLAKAWGLFPVVDGVLNEDGTESFTTTVHQLEVAGVRRRQASAWVRSMDAYNRTFGAGGYVGGFLGLSTFWNAIVVLDYERGRMVIAKGLADLPEAVDSIPMDARYGYPAIPVRVGPLSLTFLVQTGWTHSQLDPVVAEEQCAEALSLSQPLSWTTNGGTREIKQMSLHDVSFGTRTLPAVKIAVDPKAVYGVGTCQGSLGTNVLRELGWIAFDWPNKRLLVKKPPPK